MRALIVDDDAAVSGVFARCFSLWGWEADQSGSIAEAVGRFKLRHYDLALCDVDLPDGSGIVLAGALSKVNPLLRIIIASGDAENITRARQAGFDRSLCKPFDLRDLESMVVGGEDKLLDGRDGACYKSPQDGRSGSSHEPCPCIPTKGNAP
jgi:DNA-binding response OmpR family regulator